MSILRVRMLSLEYVATVEGVETRVLANEPSLVLRNLKEVVIRLMMNHSWRLHVQWAIFLAG